MAGEHLSQTEIRKRADKVRRVIFDEYSTDIAKAMEAVIPRDEWTSMIEVHLNIMDTAEGHLARMRQERRWDQTHANELVERINLARRVVLAFFEQALSRYLW